MIIFIPIQFIIIKLNLPFWHFLPRLLFRLGAILFGLKINVIGTANIGQPTLIVANHISWSDIVALGSIANVSFVAKSEIKKWPLIGFLASLQKTIFVERNRRVDTGRTSEKMAKYLLDGNAVVLFAEGRSDISTNILPFRSALIGSAQMAMKQAGAKNIAILPTIIAYTKLQGLPVSRAERFALAWNKSKSSLVNIINILKRSNCEITIVFANPIKLKKDADRKKIARQCHQQAQTIYNVLLRSDKSMEDIRQIVKNEKIIY